MRRVFSLAYLTCEIVSAPEAVQVAARAGYDAVGLRIAPAMPGGDFSPLIGNQALLREVQARLQDTGLHVLDVEIIRIRPGFDAGEWLGFLETCAGVGARAVLVNGNDRDEERLSGAFAALCDAAAPFGLSCDLEFMPFTDVRDGAAALRVVEAAGRPNGHVLVDALHVARSGTTPALLAALPRHRIGYVQICDGPAEAPATTDGLIRAARQERLLPGEGGIGLREIFAALPEGVPVSVEIPHHARRAAAGGEAWARSALEASRTFLEANA